MFYITPLQAPVATGPVLKVDESARISRSTGLDRRAAMSFSTWTAATWRPGSAARWWGRPLRFRWPWAEVRRAVALAVVRAVWAT